MLFHPRRNISLLQFLLLCFRTPAGSGDEAELTVVFHIMVSDKFNMEDKTEIVIRGEDPVFDGWNKDCVRVKVEE